MVNFTGFPTGKSPYVPIPEVFFTQVLPGITDHAELKVTLHLFWLLARKHDTPRCTNERELFADRTLLHSLNFQDDTRTLEERLRQGLDKAVARGTLLSADLTIVNTDRAEAEVIAWYFFNTARNQKIVAELQGGAVLPAHVLTPAGGRRGEPEHESITVAGSTPARTYTRRVTGPSLSVPLQTERPNIFTLFEQNIGFLGTSIVEEIKDALDLYPEEWVEAAIHEAAVHNKRSWSYIRAILRRWETEGRQKWNA
jgi:DnaD/phage-associated family protein